MHLEGGLKQDERCDLTFKTVSSHWERRPQSPARTGIGHGRTILGDCEELAVLAARRAAQDYADKLADQRIRE